LVTMIAFAGAYGAWEWLVDSPSRPSIVAGVVAACFGSLLGVIAGVWSARKYERVGYAKTRRGPLTPTRIALVLAPAVVIFAEVASPVIQACAVVACATWFGGLFGFGAVWTIRWRLAHRAN
jgi:hypothetical protein